MSLKSIKINYSNERTLDEISFFLNLDELTDKFYEWIQNIRQIDADWECEIEAWPDDTYKEIKKVVVTFLMVFYQFNVAHGHAEWIHREEDRNDICIDLDHISNMPTYYDILLKKFVHSDYFMAADIQERGWAKWLSLYVNRN